MAARKKGISTGSVPVKLTYSFSVEHEYITENWGVLGDLVLVDDDELYVTQVGRRRAVCALYSLSAQLRLFLWVTIV